MLLVPDSVIQFLTIVCDVTVGLIKKLIKFFLLILLTESLDELTNLVVPLFADVENKNVVVPEWLDHPFGPEQVKVS